MSTTMSTRKCLSYSGLCRPISVILVRMFNGCLVLVARTLLQSVTNEPHELKLLHLNIDKFVLNVPAVAVVVIRTRFSSLYVVK